MKKYEPKQMVASSRYQNYFPTLPAESQQDVYNRMNELLAEEKESLTMAACPIRTSSGPRRSARAVTSATSDLSDTKQMPVTVGKEAKAYEHV